jgi:hypothetical protein
MIRRLIPTAIKPYLGKILYSIWLKSLKYAINEQGLKDLVVKLEQLVPDINDQYSSFEVNTPYLRTKVRGLHAFQISLINETIKDIENPVIVDIGDSAGTHLQYIIGLNSGNKNIKCLSVNMDIKAVERIKNKGLEVIHARAEDLQSYNVNADIFLCLETLEHLMNPCVFLHELSSKTNAYYLIVTVPYLKRSRVGLHHIRWNNKDTVNAEKTHIFELNPDDWKLIVKHSGWFIVSERIYRQYPQWGILRLTKALWKKYDFEGFYGIVLKRDLSWSKKYIDW